MKVKFRLHFCFLALCGAALVLKSLLSLGLGVVSVAAVGVNLRAVAGLKHGRNKGVPGSFPAISKKARFSLWRVRLV